jgi:excinuclease ABC subunit C
MPDIDIELRQTVSNLPHKPGVYRYYGEGGDLLYIGKAKDLKNRVSSYFQQGRPKNQRLTLMISQIRKIEYTVVSSERESIILEANLIHQLQPKYNIQLKDDRSYLYVRFHNRDPIPTISLTRRKYDPSSDYFGPYTKRVGIWNTLRTLRTIFPYCQEKTLQSRPCMYVGIKQCDGICVGQESKSDYLNKLAQIKKVLQGNTEEVEEFINQKIMEAVKIQNYELAALWRDRLIILKDTIVNQKVILPEPTDLDIVTLIFKSDNQGLEIGSVFVQTIRSGKMVNVNNFLLTGSSDSEEQNQSLETKANQFLQRFMQSYYSFKRNEAPVVVECFYDNQEVEI